MDKGGQRSGYSVSGTTGSHGLCLWELTQQLAEAKAARGLALRSPKRWRVAPYPGGDSWLRAVVVSQGLAALGAPWRSWRWLFVWPTPARVSRVDRFAALPPLCGRESGEPGRAMASADSALRCVRGGGVAAPTVSAVCPRRCCVASSAASVITKLGRLLGEFVPIAGGGDSRLRALMLQQSVRVPFLASFIYKDGQAGIAVARVAVRLRPALARCG